jgi:hypothetical protein
MQSLLDLRGHRDPWWDVDGRTARTRRRRRIVLAVSTLLMSTAVIWAGVGARQARAATTVNLDQWASSDLAWQNGNLNGNNSRYPEGGIVPFRLAMEGLATGDHQIDINFDVTAGGHKAYDFLATWNVTNASGKQCIPSGGAISSMCPSLPASSSMAFPTDPYVMDGLSVHGAEVYSGAPRRLTIWGGSLLSISGPVHSGFPSGNSTADFTIRFRSSGPAVLLAWGGHLAQSAYWNRSVGGPSDGAAMVSGAPWHMRTLQLDGSGNKNQDRSIQPSAIVGELPPFALAPTPPPTGGGGTPGGPASGPGAPGGPGSGPRVTLPPTSPSGAFAGGTGDGVTMGLASALTATALVLGFLLPLVRRRRRP